MNDARPTYFLLLAGVAAWCMLALSPPVFAPGSSGAGLVYAFFARICHQWDSHSLHLFGVKLAVCERCLAIYLGTLGGVLLAPFVRGARAPAERWLWIAAAAPMALDVLLDASPWYAACVASRLSTGGFFGVTAGVLLVPSFLSACTALFARHLPEPPHQRSYEPTT